MSSFVGFFFLKMKKCKHVAWISHNLKLLQCFSKDKSEHFILQAYCMCKKFLINKAFIIDILWVWPLNAQFCDADSCCLFRLQRKYFMMHINSVLLLTSIKSEGTFYLFFSSGSYFIVFQLCSEQFIVHAWVFFQCPPTCPQKSKQMCWKVWGCMTANTGHFLLCSPHLCLSLSLCAVSP